MESGESGLTRPYQWGRTFNEIPGRYFSAYYDSDDKEVHHYWPEVGTRAINETMFFPDSLYDHELFGHPDSINRPWSARGTPYVYPDDYDGESLPVNSYDDIVLLTRYMMFTESPYDGGANPLVGFRTIINRKSSG
jgi:hypothetical protein